jgi:hypothetical protein
MNRRDFIAKFSNKVAVAGMGIAATTAVVYPKVRKGAAAGMQKLAGEVKSLTRRIDDMEASQRRMVKLLITVASVSTGLDALTLIKGDWL